MTGRNAIAADIRAERDLNSALTSQSPQHVLASTLSSTVVTVNFRLGTADEPRSPVDGDVESAASRSEESPVKTEAQLGFQYPTPIHDTLAGFDWIQNTLKPAKLGVFGSHVGGSLSLMLALTEARSVQAVAALDPICDWPGLDEYCEVEGNTDATTARQKRLRKGETVDGFAAPDLVPLLKARERFFSSPERCFDAFASPVLFLRSAGRDVPRVFPQYRTGPEYPVPVVKDTGSSTSTEDLDAQSLDGEGSAASESSFSLPPSPRRRKALSRWPPYGLDYGISEPRWSGHGHGIGRLQMTLPWVRIFLQDRLAGLSEGNSDVPVGSTVLSQQGEEMVSVMRRACFWGREKGVGEQRVTLTRVNREVEEEVGKWFGDVLDGKMDES